MNVKRKPDGERTTPGLVGTHAVLVPVLIGYVRH